MSELAIELRAIGRAINHDEYVDAGVVPLTLAHAAARIEQLEAALREIMNTAHDNGMWLMRDVARTALDKSSPP